MLVYRDKYLDEAVNWDNLTYAWTKSTGLEGPSYKDNQEKVLNSMLNTLDPENKPLTDKDLRAYGTSRKELLGAIEYLIKWWNTPPSETDERLKIEKEAKRKFDSEGKLRDSGTFDFIKAVLDNMSDEDYEDLALTLEDKDGPEYFDYLNPRCANLFNISKEEAERSFNSNRSRLRGYMVKAGAKRKIKKVGNKIKDTVKSKVKAVKDFGDKIRGFFS